ncbi:hypothetical protein GCM10020258_56390 [Sphingomonas yabuuchiae]
MADQPRGGVSRDGERARADGEMGVGHAHQIDHEWDGEDRAAPADKPEGKAHQAAG